MHEQTATGPLTPDAPVIDPTVDAEEHRRFQIAHLMVNLTTTHVAERLKVSERTVQRWVLTGVNWDQADDFACRVLGVNPVSLWGTQWEAAADEAAGELQPTLFD